ncbi:AfsR/SARP family transcriptional regulator [Streptomyces aurantiacus]|uniref:AfsR/SARP family transcriptional regulator n=1 Tax=Streptomyces aurantiacus TaxID=47760 RepID=UPI0027D887E6|nr:AfsR/SARP family transcriptional regulator [Streptomyces aurantiacus]
MEVTQGGAPVPIGGLNSRAVLGLLLVNANAPVRLQRFVEALWDDNPPATGRKIIQNAVSRLRRVLLCAEPAAAPVDWSLATVDGGYTLRVADGLTDTSRFRAASERGRTALLAGDWDGAGRALREALALWRGPVLEDLAEHGLEWPERTLLQEARFRTLEDRVTADLMLGQDAAVADELALVAASQAASPRLYGQLMLALYRGGRQAEALEAYQRARNDGMTFTYEELDRLQAGILAHDPALRTAEAPLLLLDRLRGEPVGNGSGGPPSSRALPLWRTYGSPSSGLRTAAS